MPYFITLLANEQFWDFRWKKERWQNLLGFVVQLKSDKTPTDIDIHRQRGDLGGDLPHLDLVLLVIVIHVIQVKPKIL